MTYTMLQTPLRRSPFLVFRQLSALCSALTKSELSLLLILRRDGYVQYISSAAAKFQKNRSVTFSTILSQNEMEFQELPILVRLMDKSMIPFLTYSYQGESVHSAAADVNFKYLLAECNSLKQIYELLNMPSERLHGNSASATLVRMTELQRSDGNWDQLDSFVYKAIANGLCHAVAEDVSKLTNDCLLSLVPCYFFINEFSEDCTMTLRDEIKKRIIEAQFKMPELCKLSAVCCMEDGDQELVHCIWAYISQQVADISEDDIPIVLSSLPPTHKFLLPLFGKPFHRIWWKLNSTEIVMCLNNLVKLNALQVNIMRDIGSWFFLNIHEVKEQEVSQCIRAFHHFNFYDGNLMSALERYIPAKNKQLCAELLALVAEYCRSRRYFSPAILDAMAVHFCANSENYQPSEIFSVLRVFGQLNYLPQDELPRFLFQAEKVIEKYFDNLGFCEMCELVCSFAFVEKIPFNIVQKVFSYSFLTRIKSSPQGHKAGMWLEMLQSAVKLDAKGFHMPCLFKHRTRQIQRDTRVYILHKRLKECLEELLGSGMVKIRPFADRSVYVLDAEIIVTAEGIPKPVSYEDDHHFSSEDKKVAVLITTAENVCLNTNHVLGKFAMRQRHLRKMGYTVIEVPDNEFMPLNRREQHRFLRNKLKAMVDFMKLSL